jgi:DNA-binding YbaB/EbfC family protein
MFKGLGQMMDVFKLLPRIQEESQRLQQRLAQLSAEGEAGAGLVKVRVNGRHEVVACLISEEAFQGDREVLEEMVRGAVNQAMERLRQQAGEETRKMATDLGLPPGMDLPGMPAPGA